MFLLLDLFYEASKSNRQKLMIILKMFTFEVVKEDCLPESYDSDDFKKIVFNKFFKRLVEFFIEENNTICFKIIECEIYYRLNRNIYCLHRLMELYNDKLSFSDEFLIYRFKKSHCLKKDSDTELSEKYSGVELYFHFAEKLSFLIENIINCSRNNMEYWKELREDNPSFFKINSLSLRYCKYQDLIKNLVEEIL